MRQRASFGSDGVREAGQHLRIERVGFASLPMERAQSRT
jgi:hypothetical protein